MRSVVYFCPHSTQLCCTVETFTSTLKAILKLQMSTIIELVEAIGGRIYIPQESGCFGESGNANHFVFWSRIEPIECFAVGLL